MLDKETTTSEFFRACAFLRRRGWLSERSPAEQDAILGVARLVSFGPGETIYHMGDRADGVYGVVSPGVRILLPADDGQVVDVHRAEAGFWAGESALLADGTRLVSLIATQQTTAVHIPRATILDLVEADSSLFRAFYALSHRNLATALRLLANMSLGSSARRLAMRLFHYEEVNGAPGDWIEIGQSDLAELVAVSLPTLQRIIRRLVAAGALESGYGRVRVLDREKLLALCND